MWLAELWTAFPCSEPPSPCGSQLDSLNDWGSGLTFGQLGHSSTRQFPKGK